MFYLSSTKTGDLLCAVLPRPWLTCPTISCRVSQRLCQGKVSQNWRESIQLRRGGAQCAILFADSSNIGLTEAGDMSSWVVRAYDWQCQSHNSSGFNPTILWHSGIWLVAGEAMLHEVTKKIKKQIPLRDSATRFLTSGFLHGSVSPKPLIIPLGQFQIF